MVNAESVVAVTHFLRDLFPKNLGGSIRPLSQGRI